MSFSQRREAYLLRKYGMSLNDFADLMRNQGGCCFICGSPPKARSLHVDHEHCKGYKKMLPKDKKKYVRGLLCFRCNKIFMQKGMTREKAEKIIEYLDRYMHGYAFK